MGISSLMVIQGCKVLLQNIKIYFSGILPGVILFRDTFTHGFVENQSVITNASFINKQLGKKEHKAKLGKV